MGSSYRTPLNEYEGSLLHGLTVPQALPDMGQGELAGCQSSIGSLSNLVSPQATRREACAALFPGGMEQAGAVSEYSGMF